MAGGARGGGWQGVAESMSDGGEAVRRSGGGEVLVWRGEGVHGVVVLVSCWWRGGNGEGVVTRR